VSNKAIEQYLKEKQEREAAVKAKRGAELQRLTDEHDKRMKAEEAERKRQIEAADKRREERFEAELEEEARTLFYSGNPGAAPSLWQTVRDEYRRLVMRRRAEDAASTSHSIYKW
jgi:hypothetical protein